MILELGEDDVDLLHTAVASQIAALIMRQQVWDEHPGMKDRYDDYVELGRKIGMEL